MIIHVGMLLEDKDFAYAFCKGVSRINTFFQFHIGSYLNCNLILIDYDKRKKWMDVIPEEYRKRCIFLRDSAVMNETNDNVYYKYCDSQYMGNEIYSLYTTLFDTKNTVMTDINQRIKKSKNKCKVITFFSYTGGCGVTSLTISTGKLMNILYGKKSLYVNLNNINDSHRFIRFKNQIDFRRVILDIRREVEENIRLINLNEIIYGDNNLDYLKIGPYNKYSDDIDGEVCEILFNWISQNSDYDFILIDIGKPNRKWESNLIGSSTCNVYLDNRYEKDNNLLTKNLMLHSELNEKNVIFTELGNYKILPKDVIGIEIDEKSFVNKNGLMKINLSGKYGKSVEYLSNTIISKL